MKNFKLNSKRTAGRSLALLVATGAIFTAGCANMETTAIGGDNSLGEATSISGNVKGGNQPVQFATVQLYGAGQKGAGSAATLLATTATSASGGFGFNKQTSGTFSNTGNTYVCPTGADNLLYVKVTGGNTTGNNSTSINNTASVFLAPIGYCSQVTNSTFVNISEVTTAAMVAATAQFINPSTESIGADGIGVEYAAIGNSFKLVSTLVNQATGLSNPSVSLAPATGGINASTVTITATPEASKLNTVANILSSCINQVSATSSTNCTTLFNNATPPSNAYTSQPGTSYPTATDTLQAALYMFLNPTDSTTANRTNLYNLSPATGAPYQPTLTALPTDWTVAVSYATTGTCGSTGASFFNKPSDINIDINGNVWIANDGSNTGALVELTNTGQAVNCATLNAQALAGGTVDDAGNIWVGDSVNNKLYRFTPAGANSITGTNPANTVRTYTTAAPVIAIAADGADNIFFTTATGGVGSVYKIANGATTDGVNTPVQVSNVVGATPSRIFPDTVGDLFVTSGSSYVTEVTAATGGPNFLNNYSSVQINGIPSPTYGVVVGPQNRVYITSRDPGASLTVLAPNSGSTTYSIQPGFPTAANTGGLSNPAGIWIDGEQTSYVANGTANSSNGLYGLSVVNINGTAISASGNANGSYQKSATYFNAMRQPIVDSSGNVWITNDNNPNSITEVVGAGVMIYAPYSSGLKNAPYFQSNP